MTATTALQLMAGSCLPLGLYLMYRSARVIAGKEIAEAEVVELRPDSSALRQYLDLAEKLNELSGAEVWPTDYGPDIDSIPENRRTWHTVAAFRAANGKPYYYVSPMGSRPPAHQPGERIRVFYPPEHPEQVRSLQFLTHFGFAWSLLGLALFSLWLLLGFHFGDQLLLARFPNTY